MAARDDGFVRAFISAVHRLDQQRFGKYLAHSELAVRWEITPAGRNALEEDGDELLETFDELGLEGAEP